MTLRYAGLVSRGTARAIDLVLLAVLVGGASWLVQHFLAVNAEHCPLVVGWWSVRAKLCHFIPYVVPAAGVTFPPIYHVIFWTIAGQTPGMAFLGLRLLRADGRKVTVRVALTRFLVFFLTIGTGALLMLVTKRRRALHDLAAGTVVVYDWDGATPAGLQDRGLTAPLGLARSEVTATASTGRA